METVTTSYGILSVLPPLIAIALALITKQTVFSLIVGLWSGVTIISGWNPILALPRMISDFFIPLIANESNAGMLILITSCGGFVYMVKVSGAAKAFGDAASKKVKTRTQAQLVTYFSAFAFIYTEPTLTLGSLMRPISEKLKVSRVKLAYICDVMGCPFATLSPITSYSTYATSLIAAQFVALSITDNPWVTFVKAIPFNFYALFGMLTLLFVIITKLDIGPMYDAEKRAVETGKLIGDKDIPMSKYDMDEDAMFQGKNITIWNFLVPIIVLFGTLIAMIMWTGDAKTNGIGGAFMHSSISLCISLSFFISAAAAGIMGVVSGVMKWGDIVPQFCKGVSLNSDIPLILILAWSIGSLTGMMDLKGYLIHNVFQNPVHLFEPCFLRHHRRPILCVPVNLPAESQYSHMERIRRKKCKMSGKVQCSDPVLYFNSRTEYRTFFLIQITDNRISIIRQRSALLVKFINCIINHFLLPYFFSTVSFSASRFSFRIQN